jgi:hypothetical protein
MHIYRIIILLNEQGLEEQKPCHTECSRSVVTLSVVEVQKLFLKVMPRVG